MAIAREGTGSMGTATETFEQWAIVELMGHVRVAGRVTEEEHFGAKLGRIDIPAHDGGFTTQFFGGSSVYRLTPTTEDIARAVALHSQPEPVHRFELTPPKPPEPYYESLRHGAAALEDPNDDDRDDDLDNIPFG